MNGGGRSNLQPPFVRDYPPARDNLPPPFTLAASPSRSSAVRAGPPDRSTPIDSALGGYLTAAVEAAASVVVVGAEVLGRQLEAGLVARDLVRVVGVESLT